MTGSERSAGAPATAEPRTVTDEGNARRKLPFLSGSSLRPFIPPSRGTCRVSGTRAPALLGGSKPECLRRTYISTASGVMTCACPELKAILANCPKAQAFSIYDRCRVPYERY